MRSGHIACVADLEHEDTIFLHNTIWRDQRKHATIRSRELAGIFVSSGTYNGCYFMLSRHHDGRYENVHNVHSLFSTSTSRWRALASPTSRGGPSSCPVTWLGLAGWYARVCGRSWYDVKKNAQRQTEKKTHTHTRFKYSWWKYTLDACARVYQVQVFYANFATFHANNDDSPNVCWTRRRRVARESVETFAIQIVYIVTERARQPVHRENQTAVATDFFLPTTPIEKGWKGTAAVFGGGGGEGDRSCITSARYTRLHVNRSCPPCF